LAQEHAVENKALNKNLFEEVKKCLLITSVEQKLLLTRQMVTALSSNDSGWGYFGAPVPVEAPGRPKRPELVRPNKVPRRGFGTAGGRAVMMHAIAHIEFNAINLALDAVQRFAGMPDEFYTDWLHVAAEEACHFEMIRAHMRHLGADYGDFPAHNGLWEMAVKTAGDVLVRMVLVPRVLEARGLDVTPGIQEKMRQARDSKAVSILDVILRDEIGHVETGSRWFRYLCDQRGLDPDFVFHDLLHWHFPKGRFGPFNLEARRQAGFSPQEIASLAAH